MKEGWTSLHKTIREINLVFKGLRTRSIFFQISFIALQTRIQYFVTTPPCAGKVGLRISYDAMLQNIDAIERLTDRDMQVCGSREVEAIAVNIGHHDLL